MSKITVTTIAGATSGSDANKVKIESGDTLQVESNATVGGTLGVTGATTVGGTLGVTGATTVGGDLTTAADVNIIIQGTHNEGGALLDLKGTDTPADAKNLGSLSFGNSTDRSLAMIRGVSEASDAAGLRFYTESTGAAIEERMRISSTGIITKPYQPAWGARSLSNTTSSGGTSGTNEILKFASVLVNIGSHYNASTGVFTCPVAGRYFVTFSGLYDDSYNNTGTVYIRVNGAEKYRAYHHNSGSYYEQISSSGVVDAAANDTIDIYSSIAGWHVGGETQAAGFLIG